MATTSVLFVSRRNSLRSVLAHAYLSHIGGRRFVVESCGQPAQVPGAFHPVAIEVLQRAGIPLPASPPKTWGELWRNGAPRPDIVVTLDEGTMAGQPAWPAQPITALWAMDDAAGVSDVRVAKHMTTQMLFALQRRLELLVNLPLHGNDRAAIHLDLRDLGRMS